jgi:hypothetical protein
MEARSTDVVGSPQVWDAAVRWMRLFGSCVRRRRLL